MWRPGKTSARAQHHAGRAAEADGADLGDAVRQDPGPELRSQPPGGVERRHGAQHEPGREQQVDHRHPGGEAEGEAEHPHLGVVGEEEGGEDGERPLTPAVEHVAQLLGRGGGIASLGHALVHEAVVALRVRHGHPVSREDAQDHQGDGERHEAQVAPHHAGEVEAEELGDGVGGPALGAVDADVGSSHQGREVIQQVLVQTDGRGHGERADGAPVERRQAVQLRRREATPGRPCPPW